MERIGTLQLVNESGATYRQLTYWVELAVVPDELVLNRGRGSGNHLRWSRKAIPVCYVLARLQSNGVKIQTPLLTKLATVLTAVSVEDWPPWLPIPGAEHVIVDLDRLRSAFGREHPESMGWLLRADA